MLRRVPAQGIGGGQEFACERCLKGGGLNGIQRPPVVLVPQRLRSLRSLGEPANALRRKPHDNPPADAGAQSPSIPLRACVPPAGPRGRPAGWPQRPSPLTPRILPSQEPRHRNGATAETATNARPGDPCAPPAPLPHSAPFRSPNRQRLLVCPAANASRPNRFQRGETVPAVSAPSAGYTPAVADSPSKKTSAPVRGLAPARLMRRGGFDARGATPLNQTTPPARSQAHSPP